MSLHNGNHSAYLKFLKRRHSAHKLVFIITLNLIYIDIYLVIRWEALHLIDMHHPCNVNINKIEF